MPFVPIHTHFDIAKLRIEPCEITILIVTDASGGFGEQQGFHLGHMLRVLDSEPWPHIRFAVTARHRQDDGFRFDQAGLNLNEWSQIWLFGIHQFADPLSESELDAISRFMDAGGGVFATGDHQNLGQAMCAEIPRVRSMRRWHFPNQGPNGEPVAPDQSGALRHDTVVDTDPAIGLQGTQSDKVPQRIVPTRFSRITGRGPIRSIASFPHPLLCGPDGPITYLPDHMHEGLCEVPSDLNKSFTFNGNTYVEYPTHAGHKEQPKVIAEASSGNGGVAGQFGVLAAYDGHLSNVGRVVVDATWHHWFNINLVGFISATNPADPINYDPHVVPQWEEIKSYFRNVALWLAHPSLQGCIRRGGWRLIAVYYDILITFGPLNSKLNLPAYYFQMGIFARDAFGRIASRCQSTRWILDIIREFIPFRVDPWQFPPKELPEPPPWLDINELETIAAGGALHSYMEKFEVREAGVWNLKIDDDTLMSVLTSGAKHAVHVSLEQMREAGKAAADLSQRLDLPSKDRIRER